MKYTLFFSDKCPDTPASVQKLQDKNIDYQEINITDSMPNLKQFLKLRDNRDEYNSVKEAGSVGVPSLLIDDGRIILSLSELEEL